MISKPWSDKEVEKLKKLNQEGKTPREISNDFTGRSYEGISRKLQRLNLKVRDVAPLIRGVEESLIAQIKKGKKSLLELSNILDIGPNRVRSIAESLHEKGYIINIEDDTLSMKPEESPVKKINIEKFFGGKPEKVYLLRDGKKVEINGFNYKFGAIADSHIGSKYERLDVLNALYDIFEKEEIKVVLHGGNYVDGEFRFNKLETITHGFDEMIDYFLKNYPKRKGIKTFFISGDDHEGWWTQDKGIDPGKVIEERQVKYGRDDLVYLGYQEANLELKSKKGSALLKILHGGKGTSYADSYRTQKMVEALQEGEKPHIMLVGHYHKALYHTPRGVHSILLGCTQDQTRFMRKNEIKAYVGGWLIEINQADTGEINRFKPEWIQFWDKKFYQEEITHKENIELDKLLKE